MLQRASLYHQAGQPAKAEEIYRDILRNEPDNITAIMNLGCVLHDQGKLNEALEMFRRAVKLKPDMPLAYINLGGILCERGCLEESFTVFRRHAALTYEYESNEPIQPHKASHDREQQDYINRNQRLNNEIAVNGFHIEDCSRVIIGGAVNPDASPGDVATRWQGSHPKIVVIDNFLTDEALAKLRRFCWRSTIWRQVYTPGYLGAMPEHGIGSPLLAQIAEELRSTYPVIFGQYPLLHFWGFKYDSNLSGIALHADFAAVNVNFWITSDDANRDPASGGLIIWDTPAPLDWDFAKYNDNVATARDFLARAGAKSMTIPYRSNRVVIFDSNLFHETDRIDFKEGYLNRRINLTLLYGRREAN